MSLTNREALQRVYELSKILGPPPAPKERPRSSERRSSSAAGPLPPPTAPTFLGINTLIDARDANDIDYLGKNDVYAVLNEVSLAVVHHNGGAETDVLGNFTLALDKFAFDRSEVSTKWRALHNTIAGTSRAFYKKIAEAADPDHELARAKSEASALRKLDELESAVAEDEKQWAELKTKTPAAVWTQLTSSAATDEEHSAGAHSFFGLQPLLLKDHLVSRRAALQSARQFACLWWKHGHVLWRKALETEPAADGSVEAQLEKALQSLREAPKLMKSECINTTGVLAHWTAIAVAFKKYLPAVRHLLECQGHWQIVLGLPDEEFEHRLQLAIKNCKVDEKRLWDVIQLLHMRPAAMEAVTMCREDFLKQQAMIAEANAAAQAAATSKTKTDKDDDGKGRRKAKA